VPTVLLATIFVGHVRLGESTRNLDMLLLFLVFQEVYRPVFRWLLHYAKKKSLFSSVVFGALLDFATKCLFFGVMDGFFW
jgi:hypothetical protein